MKTLEEFISAWSKAKSGIKRVHFSYGFILANSFMPKTSEYDGSYFITLRIEESSHLTETGYIALENVKEID